jgi:aerobic-type carbon monoxide dehydrogenase small subunit (CoxS/CutS family)
MNNGTGSCTVNYRQAGDANHNAAQTTTETVTAQKAAQAITFDAIADKVFGDSDFAANATSSQGLVVNFAAAGNCTNTGSTVHINGEVQRSCVMPVSAIGANDRIVTIEGLSANASHPVQQAWAALDVPQCGYCQSGQIMAAAALLRKKPNPTDNDIDDAMTNICRCGTYQRIRAAVHMAAGNKVATAGNAPAATPGGGS